MEEVNAVMQYAQIVQAFGTDGAVAIKTDMVVDYIGDKLGVPANLRNNAAERAVLMEEMQNQQRNALAMQAVAEQQMAQAEQLPA